MTRWAYWVVVWAVVGCSGEPRDDGVVGPEGGVLRFDAAMIGRDGGAPDVPFDAARLDTGRPDTGLADSPMERRCTGVSRSCASFGSSATCASQDGCRRSGECRGVSTSCYSYFSSFACAEHDGCYWSSSFDECSGSARSCYGYASETSCVDQDGCYWQDTCEGVSTSCFGRTAATCALQEGCYLE